MSLLAKKIGSGIYASKYITIALRIDSTEVNVNLKDLFVQNTYWRDNTRKILRGILYVNGTIGSNSSTTPALSVGGFRANDTITIINNGSILGAGGTAGTGGVQANGSAGGVGGDAITTTNNLTIYNRGSIWAGGGGGGGGGSYYSQVNIGCNEGCNGCYCTGYDLRIGSDGSANCQCAGSWRSCLICAYSRNGGTGGAGQGYNQSKGTGSAGGTSAGSGGDGATYGLTGSNGTKGLQTGGTGGLAGYYINRGSSTITLAENSGTVLGRYV